MRRVKLTIAYDGTNYCGWQIQPNGITIEEIVNKALSSEPYGFRRACHGECGGVRHGDNDSA